MTNDKAQMTNEIQNINFQMKKKIILSFKNLSLRFILSFVLCYLSLMVSAAVAAEKPADAPGTEMMNAHGENMELEFQLYDPGHPTIVDYEKFGEFRGVGTEQYEYRLNNRKGLAAAAGEGIFPNNSVYKDPAYRLLIKKGKLSGSQWDYVNHENQQLAFYKWATTHDTPAVQQFYTAMALEKLGFTLQAIKAYYAVVVHSPKQVGWTFWHTPLYMGRLA